MDKGDLIILMIIGIIFIGAGFSMFDKPILVPITLIVVGLIFEMVGYNGIMNL